MLGLKLNHVSKRGHWDLSGSLSTHLPLDKMAAILADGNFKRIFSNENYGIAKIVPRSPIDNKPALAQVMAWRRAGYKPLP